MKVRIRGFEEADLQRIEEIWLEGNRKAHGFVPETYFLNHLPMLRELMPKVTVLIAEEEGTALGFLGMEDGFVMGLFVDPERTGEGIGTLLLKEAKEMTSSLKLKAFLKNSRAISFYLREGFEQLGIETDEGTGEQELVLSWKR